MLLRPHSMPTTQRGKACAKSDKQRNFTELWLCRTVHKTVLLDENKLEIQRTESNVIIYLTMIWTAGNFVLKSYHSKLEPFVSLSLPPSHYRAEIYHICYSFDIVDPSSMQDVFQTLTCWVLKRNFACLYKLKAKNKDSFIGRNDVKDDHSNLIHVTVIYIGRIKCVLPSKGIDKVPFAQSPVPSQLLLIK